MYLYSAAHASHSRSVGALLLSALFLFPVVVLGSTPNTIFSVQGVAETWLVKRGEFGTEADTVTGRLLPAPDYDLYLCEYYNTNRTEPLLPIFPTEDIILAVPRGLCTFEKKAFAAHRMYGATGLLVYDNLSARYRWNTTTERVVYPVDELDYECDNGYGVVYNLTLDPPFYDGGALDHLLDSTNPSSLCNLQETRTPCESQLCVVTKHDANATEYPVCCAWDNLITMQPDAEGAGDTSQIFPVMMTIRQSQAIFPHVGQIVTLTARPYTAFNASIVLVWTVGVLITGLACWYAAQDYRIFRAKLARFQDTRRDLEQQKQQQQQPPYGATEDDEITPKEAEESDAFIVTLDDDDDEEGEPDMFVDEEDVIVKEDKKKDDKRKPWALHSLPPAPKDKKKVGETTKGRDGSDVWVLHSLPPPERKRKSAGLSSNGSTTTSQAAESSAQPSSDPLPEPWSSKMASTEMTQWHVLGFLVSASLMLFLLFYFKFFALITVLYGIGCAGAVSHLIFGPIVVRVVPRFLGDDWVRELNNNVVMCLNGFDVISQLLGYLWAIVWLWYGLTHYRPSQNWFFWITTDIFGACFCVLALISLKLSNIKIATMLMVAIFFYDIFFVFITPLFLDGESIMLTVARGGAEGTSTADDFCYKYPDDKQCTGVDFLPMLIIIPRINDYSGGSVLLGLGDIILPGFLIAFAARVDEASRLVGKHTKVDIYVPEKWYQGYFFPLMVAYGFGLFLAFLAFSIIESGQPALLYLVPTCLGTMFFFGRKELKSLWVHSRAIRLADKLQNQCERAWAKEKMKRQVEKKKRERAQRGGEEQIYERAGGRATGKKDRQKAPADLTVPQSPGTMKNENPSQQRRGSREPGSGDVRESGRGRGGRGRGRGMGGKRKSERGSERPNRESSSAGTSKPSKSPAQTANGLPPEPTQPRQTNFNAKKEEAPQESSSTPSENQKCDADKDPMSPKTIDVCFGDKDHDGTKYLLRVVKKTLKASPDAEFDTLVYNAITKKLEGRRFFVPDAPGSWKEASKLEVRTKIGNVFKTVKRVDKKRQSG